MMSANNKVKHLLTFLTWLCIAFVVVQLTNHLYGKRLVLNFYSNQNEFIQVFYPIDNTHSFSEESSEGYSYDKGLIKLTFSLPNSTPHLVRIDPLEKSGEIILREIEINGLFTTTHLRGSDLISRIKVIQSIEKIELLDDKVLIRGNGADPIMFLNLSNLSFHCDFLLFTGLIILIAIFGYGLLGAPLALSVRRKLVVVAIPIILTLLIVYIFYPGYMTYDSLHALRSARNGVSDSAWPPIVSYVWRGIDAIYPHPSAMFFAQVLLLLISTSLIVFHYTKKIIPVALTLSTILLIPVLLGTMATIWKDVLMASFLIASFYFMLEIKEENIKWKVYLYTFISLTLLFLGTASRHNAITATLPLVFYLTWQITSRLKLSHRTMAASIMGVIIVTCIFGLKIQLDKYALPSFKPISGVTTLVPVVRKLDIIAASICANENLLKEEVPSLSMEEMISGYDPRHSNNSLSLTEKIPSDVDINSLWINTFKKHPICFFSNKALLSMYLLGINSGQQFLIIAPQVNSNEYNYFLPESKVRQSIEKYIIAASERFYFRPWFIWLLTATMLIIFLYLRKNIKLDYFVLWISANFYAFGLFIFGNAADARLLFYTNYVNFLLFSLLLFELILSKRSSQNIYH